MFEEAFEVRIMISNRHVHLSQESEKILFGEAGLTFQRKTNEDSRTYACNETVTLEGPKGSISNVRVLGPSRSDNQVEILTADQYKLGIQAPLRQSGDLDGAATVKIIGPEGSVELPCAIVAERHIHLGTNIMDQYGLTKNDEVCVRVEGPRGGIFEHVKLKVGRKPEDSATMHIDQEEGNAIGIGKTGTGRVLIVK